jgi:hypothetical protein
LFLTTGHWAIDEVIDLVMFPLMASPKAKMFSNLSC